MPSPKLTVLSDNPLVVAIKKNGRSVSPASAQGVLAKHYPNIAVQEWKIVRYSHSTRAFLTQGDTTE